MLDFVDSTDIFAIVFILSLFNSFKAMLCYTRVGKCRRTWTNKQRFFKKIIVCVADSMKISSKLYQCTCSHTILERALVENVGGERRECWVHAILNLNKETKI